MLFFLSAETNANADGIIQGLTDTELSTIGYLQSQALGRYVQYHRFSHIYSSNLKRAAEVCPVFSFRFLILSEEKNQINFSLSL